MQFLQIRLHGKNKYNQKNGKNKFTNLRFVLNFYTQSKKMVKKSQKKLDKAEKNMTKHTSTEEKKPVVISLVLLVLMVSSLVAFAFVDTGTTPGSNSDSDFQNLAFGEYTLNTGETVFAAVINSEQFLFTDLEFINGREDFAQKAQTIKSSDSLQVYLAQNYTNYDGAFLLEQKVSNAFNIPVSRIQNISTCNSSTVVFTYNTTNTTYDGCTVIESTQGNELLDVQALAYFMVNDFQG